MGDRDDAHQRRRQAARQYQPHHVRLLLVAEAPPSSPDRYFYFEDVADQDSLFRYVVRAVLDEEPVRAKRAQLARLRDCGVFLVDLKLDPKAGNESLDSYVDDLVARAAALTPDHVITIKANVCDLTQPKLRAAGLSVSTERVPFPGSGWQRAFEAAIARALRAIDWRC
jgi:hypothetical protein